MQRPKAPLRFDLHAITLVCAVVVAPVAGASPVPLEGGIRLVSAPSPTSTECTHELFSMRFSDSPAGASGPVAVRVASSPGVRPGSAGLVVERFVSGLSIAQLRLEATPEVAKGIARALEQGQLVSVSKHEACARAPNAGVFLLHSFVGAPTPAYALPPEAALEVIAPDAAGSCAVVTKRRVGSGPAPADRSVAVTSTADRPAVVLIQPEGGPTPPAKPVRIETDPALAEVLVTRLSGGETIRISSSRACFGKSPLDPLRAVAIAGVVPEGAPTAALDATQKIVIGTDYPLPASARVVIVGKTGGTSPCEPLATLGAGDVPAAPRLTAKVEQGAQGHRVTVSTGDAQAGTPTSFETAPELANYLVQQLLAGATVRVAAAKACFGRKAIDPVRLHSVEGAPR